MKKLQICQIIGNAALFLASLFNIINQLAEKQIFGIAVTIPLFVIAIIAHACGLVYMIKNRRK